MTNPTVSVVMSVLNGERFLTEAIDSILRQTFDDFEFIIINDGSTDSTYSILKSYEKNDNRLIVVNQENRGLIEALNIGCSLARGELIARMDADDVALPDRFSRQVSVFQRNDKLCLLGSGITVITADGRIIEDQCFPASHNEIEIGFLNGMVSFCHPAVMMRKSAFTAVGGYRKALRDAEDYDLWLRMSEHGEVQNLSDLLLKYRRHPAQVSIRNLRQQKISHLAAQAASICRKKGNRDPLDSVLEINTSVLEIIGVSRVWQRQFVLRSYLVSIETMYLANENDAAYHAIEELYGLPEWGDAESYYVADCHLLNAKLLLRQQQIFSYLCQLVRAFIAHPPIAVRALRQFWATDPQPSLRGGGLEC